jgi:hypothetical protein
LDTLPDPDVLRERLAQLTRERALVRDLLRLTERARREQRSAAVAQEEAANVG